MSGDLPVLRFLEKLHAFSKKRSQCRVTCPFYDFLEKLHAFSKERSQCRVTCPFYDF
jgi:VanZ family protein